MDDGFPWLHWEGGLLPIQLLVHYALIAGHHGQVFNLSGGLWREPLPGVSTLELGGTLASADLEWLRLNSLVLVGWHGHLVRADIRIVRQVVLYPKRHLVVVLQRMGSLLLLLLLLDIVRL